MTHFAPFRFDEGDLTLWRGQEPLPLTRKAAHLLACLLAARGNWVSKGEILSAVWPATHVHPDNIKVLIREIRLALHDDAGNPRFIRSEAGRGYAFVAETTDRPGRNLGEPELPLFVNRTSDLSTLVEAFDAVLAGTTRVALVTGEHGIGKTTLCDAFLRVTRATAELRAASGECISQTQDGEPLQPILDAVRACWRNVPSLGPMLESAAPTWSARAPQWPTTWAHQAEETARLIAELPAALAALSHDMPLVVVLEDLQWSDPATLEAIALLAREERDARWMIVATACAHGSGHAATLGALSADWGARSSALVLDLAPWTVASVERYVDARFGRGCLTDLAPTLHEVTGGNPSMLSVATDRLVALGVLHGHANRWQRDLRVETLADLVPRALRDVVALQLEHLTDEERALLEAVSAAGLEFTAATAAIAADLPESDVVRLLDRLAHRRLVVRPEPDGSGRPPSGPRRYRFLHPTHLDLLIHRAPITQQIRSARRLAEAEEARVPHERVLGPGPRPLRSH